MSISRSTRKRYKGLLDIQRASHFWVGSILMILSRFCTAMTLRARGCGDISPILSFMKRKRVADKDRYLLQINTSFANHPTDRAYYSYKHLLYVSKTQTDCLHRVKLPAKACHLFPRFLPFPANFPTYSSITPLKTIQQPCSL